MNRAGNDQIVGTDRSSPSVEHFEVLIMGAGVSGIGSAHHLAKQCPDQTFVVLEAQANFGGTWLTHRFPGIRSDSDLFTYGFAFKPWTGPTIASAAEIRAYLGEVIDEANLAPHIRYGHKVTSARWSSDANLWTVLATRFDTGETVRFTANFLWMCQGYYRHSEGYTPHWSGMETFKGRIVHPQTWPDDLNMKGQKVVVIGSGSTAVTLIPAIADDGAQVTMLQRSPAYFVTEVDSEPFANELRALDIDKGWLHEIMRRKIIRDEADFTKRTFTEPDVVKKELIDNLRQHLDPDYDVETHFTPSYRPWRQRICLVPDGDLFRTIREGKTTVVTDHIDHFTETGIHLKSGKTIEADIIVTSTGFAMSLFGDIAVTVNGVPFDFTKAVTYRGMMLTGLPNLAWVYAYFRSAWTPRVDLVADFVCRLIRHMQKTGAKRVTPTLRPEDADMPLLPWLDEEDINAGYLVRGRHLMPKRGDKPEWQHSDDLLADQKTFPSLDLGEAALVYE